WIADRSAGLDGLAGDDELLPGERLVLFGARLGPGDPAGHGAKPNVVGGPLDRGHDPAAARQPHATDGGLAGQGRDGAGQAAAPPHAAERPVTVRDLDAVVDDDLLGPGLELDHEVASRARA